ncbi:hypothetical protein ABPG74_010486 [Tetrahymena malaccensis]
MDQGVEKIPIKQFAEWYDIKYDKKYEKTLQGLKFAFYKFYALIQSLIQNTIAIQLLLIDVKHDDSISVKELLDSQLHILKGIILDYPKLIDWEFCEFFQSTIADKVNQVKVYFHPITHFTGLDKSLKGKFKQLLENSENGLSISTYLIKEIYDQILISQHQIKSTQEQRMFIRQTIKSIIDEIKEMKQNKAFHDYFELFTAFMTNSLQENKELSQNREYLILMMNLLKELIENQKNVESCLANIINMCHIIKNKGKKVLREDISIEEQQILSKFVKLIVKPDFLDNFLLQSDQSEYMQAVKILEKQNTLIKEMKQNRKLLDEGTIFNEKKFKAMLEKWIQCKKAIEQLNSSENYQLQFLAYELQLKTSSQQLYEKFEQKQRDFSNTFIQYHQIYTFQTDSIKSLQKIVQKEFGIKVEIEIGNFIFAKI